MPRTEQEILKDFETIEPFYKWRVVKNNEQQLVLRAKYDYKTTYTLRIDKEFKLYRAYNSKSNCCGIYLSIPEHKLLHELFTCWGWI